ncbi:MAG TPA: GAF domain-containing protein [Anaerolineae bacterium]|nr:GAF domain-containing protein [Anaerolineae bacterium]
MITLPLQWREKIFAVLTRLIDVKSVGDNAEEIRLGRLFNILMLMSLCFSCMFCGMYVFAWRNAWIENVTEFWLQGAFALMFVPFGLVGYIQTKRGNMRRAFALYIGLCLAGISIAIYLFGGTVSPWWLMYFWPLTLVGVFLPLWYVPMTVLGVLVYYLLLFVTTRAHTYQPLVGQSATLFWFIGQALTLMLLTAVPGILAFVNARLTRDWLQHLQDSTQSLEATRRELAQRVETRTAVLQKRAEQFQAIAELSRAASSIQHLQPLLDTTVNLIAERLGFYHVAIFLVDPTNAWAVLQAASSEGGQRMLARGHRMRVGQQGIVGYVSSTGIARFAFRVGEDTIWFNNPELPDTKSEMALPLIARDETIGVLDIQTKEEAAFGDEDVAVLRILADSIAVAIANTRSLADARETLERLSRYQEQDALRAWRQALARRNMSLDYDYASGIVNRLSPEEATLTVSPADVAEVTTTVAPDGMHLLLAPLTIRRQKLGVLAFEKPTPWTEEQLQFTRFVVEQLDLALDNARLLEETTRRANQQRARSEIMARVRVGGSTDAIMRGAVEELGRALQVERSRIQLLPLGEQD